MYCSKINLIETAELNFFFNDKLSFSYSVKEHATDSTNFAGAHKLFLLGCTYSATPALSLSVGRLQFIKREKIITNERGR